MTTRGNRSRARTTWGAFAFVVLALGCNRIGDQICDPGFDPNDLGDQCPYGPPGGPKVKETGCPDIAVDPTGPECGKVSWDDDIWPLLNPPNSSASCSAASCHEPPGSFTPAGGLRLPAADPEKSFAVLESYMPTPGYPYVSDKSPAHTWILCNLHGDKGGSQPMPPPPNPLIADADYQKVVAWARCGEPRTRTSGTGGTGGTGGGI